MDNHHDSRTCLYMIFGHPEIVQFPETILSSCKTYQCLPMSCKVWLNWLKAGKNDNCSPWFASEKFKNHHRQGLNPAFLRFRFPLNQQLGGVQILLPFPFVLIIPNEFPHLQPKLPTTMLLSDPWASWRFAKFRQGWVKTLNNWDFEWEHLWTYHGD